MPALKRKKFITIISLAVLPAIFFLFLFRPAKKTMKIGALVPVNIPITQLAALLKDPLAYQDKEVLLEGTVGYFCSSGCEFTYQEGVNSINVFSDFGAKILPLLKEKRPVRVYGKVKGGEKPFILLLGLDVKEVKK